MKMVNKVGVVRPPFDVPDGLGEILSHLHLAEKNVAPAPKILHANTRWLVEPSSKTNSGEQIAPYIRARCACGANCDRFSGPNPASIVIRHLPTCDGGLESPSAECIADYLEHRSKFHPPQSIGAAIVSKLERVRADLKVGIVRT